jgi:hypothetical protein
VAVKFPYVLTLQLHLLTSSVLAQRQHTTVHIISQAIGQVQVVCVVYIISQTIGQSNVTQLWKTSPNYGKRHPIMKNVTQL